MTDKRIEQVTISNKKFQVEACGAKTGKRGLFRFSVRVLEAEYWKFLSHYDAASFRQAAEEAFHDKKLTL